MIKLRALLRHEQSEVAKMFHEIWHETHAPLQHPLKAKYRNTAFFMDRLKSRANTIVAHDGQHIVGFVSWTDSKLNTLFVAKTYRNQSVGLALLSHAEQAMMGAGATALFLDCAFGNDAAKRFYERHGWRVDRIENNKREKPEGVIFSKLWVMVKP